MMPPSYTSSPDNGSTENDTIYHASSSWPHPSNSTNQTTAVQEDLNGTSSNVTEPSLTIAPAGSGFTIDREPSASSQNSSLWLLSTTMHGGSGPTPSAWTESHAGLVSSTSAGSSQPSTSSRAAPPSNIQSVSSSSAMSSLRESYTHLLMTTRSPSGRSTDHSAILDTPTTQSSSNTSFKLRWNLWVPWTACTTSCGGGTRMRVALCDKASSTGHCDRKVTNMPENSSLGEQMIFV